MARMDPVESAPPQVLRGEPDAGAAEWLLSSLRPMHWRHMELPVGAFVPDSYGAVARVLHPWHDGEQPVTWAAAATRLGDSSAAALDRRRDGHVLPGIKGLYDPQVGQLDQVIAERMVHALTQATTTPEDVFVAVWSGWGNRPEDWHPTAALIPTPQRGHLLLRGALSALLHPVEHFLPSGIWWPADRAWVVATEVDYHWTFVAGSNELISTLITDPRLEVLRTHSDAAANNLSHDAPPAGNP